MRQSCEPLAVYAVHSLLLAVEDVSQLVCPHVSHESARMIRAKKRGWGFCTKDHGHAVHTVCTLRRAVRPCHAAS